MRKHLPDFNSKSDNKSWYDLREDWELVEASIATQYNIRIRSQTDMPWDEFCMLVSGLMPDTPLGQIVSIRAESDPEVLKTFNPEQKKIRSDWLKRQAEHMTDNKELLEKQQEQLQKIFANMFGGKG